MSVLLYGKNDFARTGTGYTRIMDIDSDLGAAFPKGGCSEVTCGVAGTTRKLKPFSPERPNLYGAGPRDQMPATPDEFGYFLVL